MAVHAEIVPAHPGEGHPKMVHPVAFVLYILKCFCFFDNNNCILCIYFNMILYHDFIGDHL